MAVGTADDYDKLTKDTAGIAAQLTPRIVTIGKLQLLRKLVVRQIHFAAKVECAQYTSCLETVNQSILKNIVEIKENAQRVFLEREHPDIAALDQQQKLN